MGDMIDRDAVLERLELAEHDAEERDWRGGANEIARLRKYVAALPAASSEDDKLRRTIAARDRRIARLIQALDDARAQGYVTQAEIEPPIVLSAASSEKIPDRGKMIRPVEGQAMCGGYPTAASAEDVRAGAHSAAMMKAWDAVYSAGTLLEAQNAIHQLVAEQKP